MIILDTFTLEEANKLIDELSGCIKSGVYKEHYDVYYFVFS